MQLELSFAGGVVVLSFLFGYVESQFQDSPDSIDKILEHAETKTIEQINKEIDRLVNKMDDETRREHQEWKARIEKEEKERKTRIFKALPKLSTRTQQRLIRVVLTQQNQQLTVGEKERILRHISQTMDDNTKREMARHLSEKDLFSLVY